MKSKTKEIKEYYYDCHGEGYCGYATKQAAVKGAKKAANRLAMGVNVFSPSDRLISVVHPSSDVEVQHELDKYMLSEEDYEGKYC